MEITQVNKVGVETISSTLKIKYTISESDRFTGVILKDEKIIGSLNANKNGIMGLSFSENHPLSDSELTKIFSAFIKNRNELFEDPS